MPRKTTRLDRDIAHALKKSVTTSISDFYTWWKPRNVKTYTVDEARKLAARAKHYGPW